MFTQLLVTDIVLYEYSRLTIIYIEFTASLSSLGKICWMRLEDEVVRFTIIPDQGTQVWAQLPIVCALDSFGKERGPNFLDVRL